MGVGKLMNDVKPYLAMVLLQVGFSGMYIVSVASLKRGMNHFVLVVYRNLVATAAVAPLAFFFERYGCAYPLDLPARVPVFLFLFGCENT